jgi:hypothetical protein
MVITECSSIVLTVKPNGGARDFVDAREWIPKKGVDITGYKRPPFLRYSILFLRNRKRRMPAWHHPGINPSKKVPNNNKWATCLRHTHNVLSIGDLVDFTDAPMPPQHRRLRSCSCTLCNDMRPRGCPFPDRCIQTARQLLDQLHPKWNPSITHQPALQPHLLPEHPHENLTPQRTLFDQTTVSTLSLTDGFRVFAEPDEQSNYPALRSFLPMPPVDPITVFTCGASTGDDTEEIRMGCSTWLAPNDHQNRSL